MRWNSIAEMIRRSPNRVEFAERKASFSPRYGHRPTTAWILSTKWFATWTG